MRTIKSTKKQEQMQREQLRMLKENNSQKSLNQSPTNTEIKKSDKLEDDFKYIYSSLWLLKLQIGGKNNKECDHRQFYYDAYASILKTTQDEDLIKIVTNIFFEFDLYNQMRFAFCEANDEKIIEYLLQEINSQNKNSINSARILADFTNFNFDKYYSDYKINNFLNKKSEPIYSNEISITKKFLETISPQFNKTFEWFKANSKK